MMRDEFGREVIPGDWLVRAVEHGEYFRYYLVEGYTDDGRIKVHEHRYHNDKMHPVRLKQTILYPSTAIRVDAGFLPGVV